MFTQNICLNDLSEDSWQRLAELKVLIVGDGTCVGGVVANLAMLKVGEIGLLNSIDMDYVVEKVLKSSVDTVVRCYDAELWSEDTATVIVNYDIVIDCLADYKSKFVLNRLLAGIEKPFIYSSMSKYNGQVTLIKAGMTACLECLFPQGNIEVFDVDDDFELLAGAISAIQVRVLLGYVLRMDEDLQNTLISYNSDSLSLKKITLVKNPECKVCSGH